MSKRINGAQNANVTQEASKIEVDQQYFRHVDQMQRWRNQYEYAQAVENKLAELSKLSFEPVDYLAMLEKVPFVEQPIPNFEFLIYEAKDEAEKKFITPMACRAVGLILGLLTLIFGMNAVVLWIGGTIIITVLVSIYLLVQDRKKTIAAAEEAAKAEIERRQNYIKKLNEQGRITHEENEKKRVAGIEQLLVGDISAVILKIDVVVSQLKLPFTFLQVDVDMCMNVPLIRVWLPLKKIIPEQTCQMLPSGRIKFDEKDARAFNKQYVELCAALVVQLAAVIYEVIPSFNRGYVEGISKNNLANECVISMSFEREPLAEVCNRVPNGVSAVRGLGGLLECDTSLNMLPVKPPIVEEWGNAGPQDIRSLTIRIERN